MPQFIDSDFSSLQEKIWTCDRYEIHHHENLLDTALYVDYSDGYVCHTIPAVGTMFALSDHVNNNYWCLIQDSQLFIFRRREDDEENIYDQLPGVHYDLYGNSSGVCRNEFMGSI